MSALLLSTSARAKALNITFSTFVPTHESVIGKICELTFTEAFHRLGMTFTIVVLPFKRAAIEINSGHIDGDLGRSLGYGENLPNIILLKDSFISVKLVAFAKEKNIKVHDTKDLATSGLKVSYPLGSSILNSLLTKDIAIKNLITTPDRVSALRMIIKKRSDIYIDGELDIIKLLKTPEFRNSKIYNAGTIIDIPLYPLLNKRHKDLVPKLIKILRQIESEGLIKKYTKIAMDS